MADELPPSRLVRWMVLGGVILFAVSLFFRWGTRVPPVSVPATPVPETHTLSEPPPTTR